MTQEAKGEEPARGRSDESRSVGRFGPAAVASALPLSIFTFVVFAGFTPVIPTRPVVLTIFTGNALVILILLALIAIATRKFLAARGGQGRGSIVVSSRFSLLSRLSRRS